MGHCLKELLLPFSWSERLFQLENSASKERFFLPSSFNVINHISHHSCELKLVLLIATFICLNLTIYAFNNFIEGLKTKMLKIALLRDLTYEYSKILVSFAFKRMKGIKLDHWAILPYPMLERNNPCFLQYF